MIRFIQIFDKAAFIAALFFKIVRYSNYKVGVKAARSVRLK